MGLVAVTAEERISEQGKSEEIIQNSVEKNRKKTWEKVSDVFRCLVENLRLTMLSVCGSKLQ